MDRGCVSGRHRREHKSVREFGAIVRVRLADLQRAAVEPEVDEIPGRKIFTGIV